MKNKTSVMIVEDNESMVFLLSELIESHPKLQLVDTASDGQTALDKILTLKPQVVIMDICLPMYDGLDILKTLNETRDLYFPKVIITSCMGLDEITKKAMNLGASYYIVKPFDSKSLLSKIELLIEYDLSEEEGDEEASELVQEQLKKTLQNKITAVLHMVGMPPHTKGYVYIKEAVALVYADSNYSKMTKFLYPQLAETFNATPSAVEKAMRNAIDLTFERGEWEQIEKLFPGINQKGDKLTNSEFIAATVEYIKSDR